MPPGGKPCQGNAAPVSRVPGTITDGGNVLFTALLGGAGTFNLANGAIATFNAGAASGSLANFVSTAGTLDLRSPLSFLATISGFGGNDAIDLLATKSTGYSFNNNVLKIVSGTKSVASLTFTSGYTSADFSVGTDNNGGTMVKYL